MSDHARLALRTAGIALAVLGGLALLFAVSEYVRIRSVEEHCPPAATCDAKGLLTFVFLSLGACGVGAGLVGGLLMVLSRARRQ